MLLLLPMLVDMRTADVRVFACSAVIPAQLASRCALAANSFIPAIVRPRVARSSDAPCARATPRERRRRRPRLSPAPARGARTRICKWRTMYDRGRVCVRGTRRAVLARARTARFVLARVPRTAPIARAPRRGLGAHLPFADVRPARMQAAEARTRLHRSAGTDAGLSVRHRRRGRGGMAQAREGFWRRGTLQRQGRTHSRRLHACEDNALRSGGARDRRAAVDLLYGDGGGRARRSGGARRRCAGVGASPGGRGDRRAWAPPSGVEIVEI
jgi:hypothetical protein